MKRATTRWSYDVVERRKVLDEQFFRCSRLLITSAIRHRLSAASLVEGVNDIHFQLLQQLQRGDPGFRIEGRCNKGSSRRLAWASSPQLCRTSASPAAPVCR